MKLPDPPAGYSQQNEGQARAEIEREDDKNQKKTQDVVVSGDASVIAPRLIIVSPNKTRYRVLVNNAGALSTVAV